MGQRGPGRAPAALLGGFWRGGCRRILRGRQSEIERIPGQGLGLYISRYVARSHGGGLTLAIPSDGLFSVTLRLPAER